MYLMAHFYSKQYITMVVEDIKPLVKGTAEITGVCVDMTVTYNINAIDGHEYQLDIDLSNRRDVGESATFLSPEKGLYLMRWIRRANKDGSLIQLK